jgi:hypothetical protein
MTSLSISAATVAIMMTVSGCGGDAGGGGGSGPAGEVSATLDGTTYTLPARCREYEGEINVSSVDDGSGVEIAARQMGEKLNLDVFVGEDDYSTPNLDDWQRIDNGVSGSGRVWLDDAEDNREHPVSFEARCS